MRIIGKIQWNLSMISQHFEIIITIKKMLVKRSVHTSVLIITPITRNYDKCNFKR